MLPHSGPPLSYWQQLSARSSATGGASPASSYFGGAAGALSYAAPPRSIAADSNAPPLSVAQLTRAPAWALPHAERLRGQLGSSATAETAIRLSITGLSASTVNSYSGLWGQFVSFCKVAGRPCSPASTATVVLYIAHLHARGTVAPWSLQPYLSAINRYHKDVLGIEPGPALGPDVNNVINGWKQEVADDSTSRAPTDERTALPADVAFDALAAADAMPPLRTMAECQQFRSLLYTGLGFALMARSDTDANLLLDDVGVTDVDMWIRLRAEKGKRRNQKRRIIRLPNHVANGLLHRVVTRWLRGQHALRAQQSCNPAFLAQRNFWRLPSDTGEWTSSSKICSQWLKEAIARLGRAPPPGFSWSSHSLRKGAASAANAIGVALHVICYHGGWSSKSGVVHDYIDHTVGANAAAAAFFSWLLPPISSSWASVSALA